MGNFVAVIASSEFEAEADLLFRRSLKGAKELLLQVPGSSVRTDWASAALFPRLNGSGGQIACHPQNGSWLLAIGTWFHQRGYSSGDESRLLERYFEVGAASMVREMEGFFVLVIGDSRLREIIVITDIVGSCHCFFRSYNGITMFSASSLLLAAVGDFELDSVGCQEFINTGIIYEDRTLYRQIRKLPAASVFHISKGFVKSRSVYWNPAELEPESLSGHKAVICLWENLVQAAQRVGTAFRAPVCDLTGGYDSRLLTAALLSSGVRFSTVVTGSTDSADVVISKGLAKLLGLPHLHFEKQEQVTFQQVKCSLALTDGEYDLVEYAEIARIHRILAERFDISINGSFGELARGYWWELLLPRTGAHRKLDALKIARLRYAAKAYDPALFPAEMRLDLGRHFAEVIERTNHGLFHLTNTFQADHAYLAMRMQRWQGRIASSTNRIWPCLSPFSFRSVLETMLQIEVSLRRRSLLVRKTLAEFQPDLAEFPLEHGYPALPASLSTLYRFWPLLGHYRKKLLVKVRSLANRRSIPEKQSAQDIRLCLWSEQEVQDLLHPATMQVRSLLDFSALVNFVARSKEQHFPFDAQWRRLLSLECTTRALTGFSSQVTDTSLRGSTDST